MCRVSAVALLGSILLGSCAASRRSKEGPPESGRPATPLEQPLERPDTTERFVPTHPPVVVPHTWREQMQKKSRQSKRTEQGGQTEQGGRTEQTGQTEQRGPD